MTSDTKKVWIIRNEGEQPGKVTVDFAQIRDLDDLKEFLFGPNEKALYTGYCKDTKLNVDASIPIDTTANNPLIFRKGYNNDKYYVRVFNVDDKANAMVNQHHVISMSYSQDSGYIDVTDYLKHGSNDFTFTVFNYGGGYSWGFEIRKNNDLIFTDKAGRVGVEGANNNDQSKPNQFVYNKTVTITVPMCP